MKISVLKNASLLHDELVNIHKKNMIRFLKKSKLDEIKSMITKGRKNKWTTAIDGKEMTLDNMERLVEDSQLLMMK